LNPLDQVLEFNDEPSQNLARTVVSIGVGRLCPRRGILIRPACVSLARSGKLLAKDAAGTSTPLADVKNQTKQGTN
jgi:hypothetical protein